MTLFSSWMRFLGLVGNAGAVANADRACTDRRNAESAVDARLSVLVPAERVRRDQPDRAA